MSGWLVIIMISSLGSRVRLCVYRSLRPVCVMLIKRNASQQLDSLQLLVGHTVCTLLFVTPQKNKNQTTTAHLVYTATYWPCGCSDTR